MACIETCITLRATTRIISVNIRYTNFDGFLQPSYKPGIIYELWEKQLGKNCVNTLYIFEIFYEIYAPFGNLKKTIQSISICV